MTRLIDVEGLKELKFVGIKNDKSLENTYRQGWNDAIDAIIDNAPTVEASNIIDGLNNEIDELAENLAWYINERNRLLKERRLHGEDKREADK